MSSTRPVLSRRAMLRGAGALMALPYLESMMTSSALAAPQAAAPARMAMFYFGTGMNMRQFTPSDEGKNFTLTRILKPLEPHRGNFTVLSGTYLEKGGGHDGAYPFSTSISKDRKQSISPDQLAAESLGADTRYASLQMSVKAGTDFGSQALATIAWNRQGVPLAAENDPHVLYNRLFKPDDEQEKAQRSTEFRRRHSVLDLVREDAKNLEGKVGASDRQRLDQYFNSVRELEKQLERRVAWSSKAKPNPDTPHRDDYGKSMTPEGAPGFFYDTYAKLMYDLIVLAFQTDSTRVCSYVVRTELAGGVYPEFGVSKGYHALTHHGNDPQNLEELAKVDTIYMSHWAYFLNRLKSIQEGNQTLLDRTVLGFSSGMGIGHSKDLLPTVISGGSGLGIDHQGHLKLPTNTPLASVWHTMLDRVGAAVPAEFQDSKGPIKQLIRA
ncbi:MAG TPA: DUF1552 domain-containing protein [Tepidisphaeraceae bacterium]|nr:DUF1552 domain-containing protein [Tepidisphaeraceae bacterium]